MSLVLRCAVFVALLSCASLCGAQSLGDVARQNKAQKSTTASSDKHVITNEEIPEQRADSPPPDSDAKAPDRSQYPAADEPADQQQQSDKQKEQRANQLRNQIRAQKQRLTDLKEQRRQLQEEIEKWQKTDCTHVFHDYSYTQNTCDVLPKLNAQNDRLNSTIRQEQSTLESMQEEVRKMGYGNSFYDPD